MDPKLRVVNVPSRVPYGLPEWRIDGGPDVEVAALLSRTDEGDRPVRKGYATCPGEVMEVDSDDAPCTALRRANVVTSVLLQYHEPCGTLLPRLG